jgi:glycosyltransferase involved in cell wall biosynthesis
VLHVLHSAPDALGGTEKHLSALIASLQPEIDFAVFHPVESGLVLHTYWLQSDGTVAEHEFLLPGGARRATRVLDENAGFALRTALDMFDFDAIHIQNLIGHSLAPLAELADFGGPVVYSFRDPFLACPSHALLYLDGEFCGIPDDLSFCTDCLPVTRQQSVKYLKDFRATVNRHIDNVDSWVFASQSAADLLLRVYDVDEDRLHVIPHGAIVDLSARCSSVDPALVYDEPLRVAFVGLGRAKKGLEVVNWLADQLADSTIEIHHFGNLIDLASGNLHLHGPYDNLVLPDLLREAGIHAVLLPGHVSETFGHVMTESLVAGIPVIGTYYGALGERIRSSGAGWTIDPTEPREILELLEHLDLCRAEVERGMRAAMATELQSVSGTADRYRALYLGDAER